MKKLLLFVLIIGVLTVASSSIAKTDLGLGLGLGTGNVTVAGPVTSTGKYVTGDGYYYVTSDGYYYIPEDLQP